MPLPYDATVKDLAQDEPAAFVNALDAPTTEPVTMLNVDLSTVSASTDLVFGIGKPLTKVVHFDCQSRAQKWLDGAVLRYNALLYYRLRVPVHSVLLLLHPRAKHANVDGRVEYGDSSSSMEFRYRVVRVWEMPVEDLLKYPPNLLPLATLGRLPATGDKIQALAAVVHSILSRRQAEVDTTRFRRLATATYVFTGMKVPRDMAKAMFLGVQGMQDSSTYQAILDEGREEGLVHRPD
jgi:predicted transposase YdaD